MSWQRGCGLTSVLVAALLVLACSASAAEPAAEVCLEFLEQHFDDDVWRSACVDALDQSRVSPAESGAASAASASSAGSVIRWSSNVNVSQLTGNQQEVAIAVDPTNPDRLFAFSNAEISPSGLFAKYSTDAGATWNFVITNGGVIDDGCCDPTASWDEFGNLFIAYLLPDGRTRVALSTNGGQFFGLVATLGLDTDQPTITTGPGSVWLNYKEFGLSGSPIVAQGASVTGPGSVTAFGTPQEMPSSTLCVFGDVAVGPNGQVLVSCQTAESLEGPSEILVSLDPDGLGPMGFATPSMASATNVGAVDSIPAQPDRTIDAEVGLAYDRSGGPNHSRVYLLYTDETPDESDDTAIYVRSSDDDGASWSSAVRVDDDPSGRSQFLPRIAVDQSSGHVAVSWHDCRHDDGLGGSGDWPDSDGFNTANNDATVYASLSWDGGVTFAANQMMSDGASDEDGSEPPVGCCDLDYGDYTGLAFVDGVFYPAWADNSNSTGDNPDANPDGSPSRMEIHTVQEPSRGLLLGAGAWAALALSALRVCGERSLRPLRRRTAP